VFVNKEYKEAKADLYACFMERNKLATKSNGFHGMINIPNWMFLSSFEDLRKSLFKTQTIDTFIHNGRGVFGSDFGSCAFVIRKSQLSEYQGSFRRLFEKQGSVASNEELGQRFNTAKTYTPSNADFPKIPGSPVAYWVSETLRVAFSSCKSLSQFATTRLGMTTANNDLFTRLWYEVSIDQLGLRTATALAHSESGKRWVPYNKGGLYKKWYGNLDTVVDWKNDGDAIKHYGASEGKVRSTVPNTEFYFKECLTWSKVSIGQLAMRWRPEGSIFDVAGACVFGDQRTLLMLLGFTNSKVAYLCLEALAPTVNFEGGQISSLPVVSSETVTQVSAKLAESAIQLARTDWDLFETSWDFATLSVLQHKQVTLQSSQKAADSVCLARFAHMKDLEEENNRLFIQAYGLQNELTPDVPDQQITLYRPDREEDIKRLLSYAIGCVMGRYSLDKPGLIYAHSGNEGFDPSQYKTFRADDDGIIPLLETDWGIRDDATNRFVEFIGVAWPNEHLEENLKLVADSLGPTSSEQPRDTIRRYLANGFYKHHLSMYKKRPIYWLFLSGKLRAFQCLVYLHRYNEGTLARMRTEYVIPLQGQIAARIEQLEGDKAKATSTSHRTKIQKEQDKLKKQQAELATFEEKLKHYADMRISLDLDDGVKVNYAKFGDLLAESKAITGGKDDE